MSYKIHKKKILRRFAILHLTGDKSWEIRKNDCDYKEADLIEFEVIDDDTKESLNVTYTRFITYIYDSNDHGLKNDYVIMSLGGGSSIDKFLTLNQLKPYQNK